MTVANLTSEKRPQRLRAESNEAAAGSGSDQAAVRQHVSVELATWMRTAPRWRVLSRERAAGEGDRVEDPRWRRSRRVPSGGVAQPTAAARQPVPWRTIWATIVSVGGGFLAYQAVLSIGPIPTYMAVSLFSAIVLTPPVDYLQRKLRLRRGVATLIVVMIGFLLLSAMIYAFVKPLAEQASQFSHDLPTYVQEAKDGRGPVGDIVKRYDLEQKIKDNQDKIQQAVADFGKNGLDIVRRIFTTIIAGLTVMVLTILVLMEGPRLSQGVLQLIPYEKQRMRVQRVAIDACRAVSGYVFGNLLISLIAGLAAWIMLLIV